jgi:hypothetical protein
MDRPFTIAVVATAYFTWSHADVIVSRWLERRETDAGWGWSGPKSRIVSMYVDQPDYSNRSTPERPMAPMARDVCRRLDVPLYPTVAEALTCGGDGLAVDGVLLIGEHGDYPWNELGQHLYPRKRLFDAVVDVFRASGRSVPVFCDKHYSWNFDWAREMFDAAREMGFLLFGGSSIPLCPHDPPLGRAPDEPVRDAVAGFFGGREVYGFHSIEFAQSILEKRAGGEVGIRAVTAYVGDAVWELFDSGGRDGRLLEAAVGIGRNATAGEIRAALAAAGKTPEAFTFDYVDGLRATHVNATGYLRRWTLAVDAGAGGGVRATSAAAGGDADYHGHFAALANLIEAAMMTGRPPFPPERTLLTTGATAAMCRAFQQPGTPLATPELHIAYGVPEPRT